MNPELMNIISIVGIGLSFIGLIWKIAAKLIDRYDRVRDKNNQREYDRQIELERQKIDLQKELEIQKKKHVQDLINAIKYEMGGLSGKVDSLTKSFYQMEGKIDMGQEQYQRILTDVEKFVEETERRVSGFIKDTESKISSFDRVVQNYTAEVKKFGEDISLVKGAANKIRNNPIFRDKI